MYHEASVKLDRLLYDKLGHKCVDRGITECEHEKRALGVEPVRNSLFLIFQASTVYLVPGSTMIALGMVLAPVRNS